jgi:hypothetical protein
LRLRFRESAIRHGINAERATFVIEHCPQPLYMPEPDAVDRVLFLGFDRHGVPLEVVAIDLDVELDVIHAMPMRRSYLDQFREMMRWRDF